MNDTVSIVVTVFNIKNYIDRCIEGLIHQTYKNIQIVLVDDGSDDGSSEICDNWAKRDGRIKVIHKSNGGLSDARNCGLEKSKGKFVCFVDGDDYVENKMIETSYRVATENDADIVVFSNYNVDSNNKKQAFRIHSKKNVYSGSEIMNDFFDECIGSLPSSKTDYDVGFSPWGRLYKKSFLCNNNIRFKSERILIYEDLMFLLDSLPVANKVVLVNEPLYNYCSNDTSLTRKVDPKRFEKIKYQFNFLKNNFPYNHELFDNKNTMLRFRRTMIGYVRNAISRISMDNIHSYQNIKEVVNDDFCQELLKDYPIKDLPKKQFLFAFLLKYRLTAALYFVVKIKNIKDD